MGKSIFVWDFIREEEPYRALRETYDINLAKIQPDIATVFSYIKILVALNNTLLSKRYRNQSLNNGLLINKQKTYWAR